MARLAAYLGDNTSLDVSSNIMLTLYSSSPGIQSQPPMFYQYDFSQAPSPPKQVEPVWSANTGFTPSIAALSIQVMSTDVAGNGASALCITDGMSLAMLFEKTANPPGFSQTGIFNLMGSSAIYFVGSTQGGMQGLLADSEGMVSVYSKSLPTVNGFDIQWQGASPKGWQNQGLAISVDRNADRGFNLVQPYQNGANLGLAVFTVPLDGTMIGPLSNTGNAGAPYSAIFLAVNPGGSPGNDHILQLANNNAVLTLEMYAPSDDGDSYVHVWNGVNMGACNGFISWFRVNSGMDDVQRVLVVYQTNNTVGMHLYEPLPNAAGYQLVWSATNMGACAFSDTWLTVNPNVNGATQILQVSSFGSINVYSYNPGSKAFTLNAEFALDLSSTGPLEWNDTPVWTLVDGGQPVAPD